MAASNCSPVHEELFQRAAKCIRENAGIEVTNEQKLQLYALFKQVCNAIDVGILVDYVTSKL